MSCPYLERGYEARCRANGNLRLRLDAGEGEADCFSGDFSDCALLIESAGPGPSRGLVRKSIACSRSQGKETRRRGIPAAPAL